MVSPDLAGANGSNLSIGHHPTSAIPRDPMDRRTNQAVQSRFPDLTSVSTGIRDVTLQSLKDKCGRSARSVTRSVNGAERPATRRLVV